MTSNCPNCERLEHELKRIANANMVTPLALYHQKTAKSINDGWVKIQADNAELRERVERYEKTLKIIQEGGYKVYFHKDDFDEHKLDTKDMQVLAKQALKEGGVI